MEQWNNLRVLKQRERGEKAKMALLLAAAVAAHALSEPRANVTLLPLSTGAAALDGSPYAFVRPCTRSMLPLCSRQRAVTRPPPAALAALCGAG